MPRNSRTMAVNVTVIVAPGKTSSIMTQFDVRRKLTQEGMQRMSVPRAGQSAAKTQTARANNAAAVRSTSKKSSERQPVRVTKKLPFKGSERYNIRYNAHNAWLNELAGEALVCTCILFNPKLPTMF